MSGMNKREEGQSGDERPDQQKGGTRSEWKRPSIVVSGPYLLAIVAVVAVADHLAKSNQNATWMPILDPALKVLCGLLTAWIVFFLQYIGHRLFTRGNGPAQDVGGSLSRLEGKLNSIEQELGPVLQKSNTYEDLGNNLSRLEGGLNSIEEKLNTVLQKTNTCEDESHCPYELRPLRHAVSPYLMSHADQTDPAEILLRNRMNILARQLAHISTEATWNLAIEDGSTQTDADLLYELITKNFVENKPQAMIDACTIPHYLGWWFSPLGFRYLQAQRNDGPYRSPGRRIRRVIKLPEGGIHTLFSSDPDLSRSRKAKEAVAIDKKLDMFGEDSGLSPLTPRQLLLVLVIHHFIGVDPILLLTPELCRDEPLTQMAVRGLQNQDLVIFGESADGAAHKMKSLLAIEVKATHLQQSGLFASGGSITFEPNKIREHAEGFERMLKARHGLNFNAIVDDFESLKNLRKRVESILVVGGTYRSFLAGDVQQELRNMLSEKIEDPSEKHVV